MFRNRKTLLQYRAYRSSNTREFCPFCNPTSEQVLKAHTHFNIIVNWFKYDVWDDSHVEEQYMIVPKRHVCSFSEFTEEEKKEHMKLVTEYEEKGFSIYTRGANVTTRSVGHHHTHVIRTSGKLLNAYLYIKKPYLMLHS
ncbi:MAG: hypothetical protein ACOCXT_02145 [Candidatus Dojkabacteria bacterium]